MDLEQLKLILDTIQTMGGDAKEFGVWWIIGSFIPDVLTSILTFIFGIVCVLSIKKILTYFYLSSGIMKVGQVLNIIPEYHEWHIQDTNKVIDRVKELQEIERKHFNR